MIEFDSAPNTTIQEYDTQFLKTKEYIILKVTI